MGKQQEGRTCRKAWADWPILRLMYLIEFYSLSDAVVAAGIPQKTETHINVGLTFKELIIVWDRHCYE